MRDFDFAKAKEGFLIYLKWREDYRVDAIPKVKFEINFLLETALMILYYLPYWFYGMFQVIESMTS